MNVVREDPATRYVFFPVMASTEKCEADSIEKAFHAKAETYFGGRVFKGTRRIGSVVDLCVWPYEARVQLSSEEGVTKAQTTLPAKTTFLGVTFTPEGWAEYKAGLSLDQIQIRPPTGARTLLNRVKKATQYAPNIYAGNGAEAPTPLSNPDDGSILSPYNDGVSGQDEPPALQGQALAESLDGIHQTLGHDGLSHHLEQMPREHLHALAVLGAVKARPHLHRMVRAAIASNQHPASETKVDPIGHGQEPYLSDANLEEGDTDNPRCFEARDLANSPNFNEEHPEGNARLQDSWQPSGRDVTTPVHTANPSEMREGIDVLTPSNLSPSSSWRYSPKWPDPRSIRREHAARLCVHPQCPPGAKQAYKRRRDK